MLDYHRRMFHYEAWANREVVEGLRECRTPPGHAVALLSHIVAAQELWLSRIEGRQSTLAVWPHWTLDECIAASGPGVARWLDYLQTLQPETLTQRFEYASSDGRSWASTVEDTLTHVILHGNYHRAQIASTMRDEGFAPAYTDFIHASRSDQIEPRGVSRR